MSDEHFRYAEQAMMMDAPRILRSTMTKLSGTLAQVAALEAAYNGIGQEQSAEAMSGLVKPLAEARHAIEQALENPFDGERGTQVFDGLVEDFEIRVASLQILDRVFTGFRPRAHSKSSLRSTT